MAHEPRLEQNCDPNPAPDLAHRTEPIQPEAAAPSAIPCLPAPASPVSAATPPRHHALPWQALTGSGGVYSRRRLAELSFELDILCQRTRTLLAGLNPAGFADERVLFRLTERLEHELRYLQALARALRAE